MDDEPPERTVPLALEEPTLPHASEVSPGIWYVQLEDGSEAYLTAGEAKRLMRRPGVGKAPDRPGTERSSPNSARGRRRTRP